VAIRSAQEVPGKRPVEPVTEDGARVYYANAPDVGTDAFDAMLDRLAPGWRGVHLTRTP
jgi:hypothetical protein